MEFFLPVQLDFHAASASPPKEKVIECDSIQFGKFPLYLTAATEANAMLPS
jgi:hypothetical protein